MRQRKGRAWVCRAEVEVSCRALVVAQGFVVCREVGQGKARRGSCCERGRVDVCEFVSS
jgi:hypothetical protein